MKSIVKSLVLTPIISLAVPLIGFGQTDEITFHKDIQPILQRSCQNCHRAGGAGPMPLETYDEVGPAPPAR